MKALQTCYMCTRKATSKEHVPPKCFFPGSGDSLSGKDLRKNLITVPSCDLHNSEKSGDDLYLLHVISVAYQNNPEGIHLFTKRIRKTAKSHPHLLKTFFGKFQKAFIEGQVTLAGELNMQRFESGMTCMANAIYFAHFATRWNEPIEIRSPSLRYSFDVPNYREGNINLATNVEPYDAGAQKYGQNQEIFYYQFIEGARDEHRLLRMVFFQGFVVLAVPLKRKEYILKNQGIGNS